MKVSKNYKIVVISQYYLFSIRMISWVNLTMLDICYSILGLMALRKVKSLKVTRYARCNMFVPMVSQYKKHKRWDR